jgi:AcrR family transcriptional regulator
VAVRTKRLSCEERKEAIVKAVLPIFARNGFASTTTRELAKAAGVSEALLYKHFPSKETLYAEIQSFGCKGCDPGLQKLLDLERSTSTLVYIVYYIMRANIVGRGKETICAETRHRLILNSCLEDGSFSRFLFHNRFAENISRIVECMDGAAAAGDLVSSPVSKPNLLLFAHHLATMIATIHLPKKPVVNYGATRDELVQQAVWFALRGLGLRDEAIKRFYNPKALAMFFGEQK